MLIQFDIWRKDIIEFGRKEGIETKITKHPSVGSKVEFYSATILIEYEGSEIIIKQGAKKYDYSNCSISDLKFEYKTTFLENFYLYIYRQNFFSRIFSKNKIIVGNELFDRTFNVKCSHRSIALKLFKKESIQQLFLSEPSLLFNISTNDKITTIVLKNLRNNLYSHQEIQQLLSIFKLIVEIVLN